MAAKKERRLITRVIRGGPFARPVEAITPSFRLPGHPRASLLCQRHDLLHIAGKGTDFARARRMKTWVRKQWDHGYDLLHDNADALDYLAASGNGKSFACGKYAQTFVECCLAVGLPARSVIVKLRHADFPHSRAGNSAHVTTEVYCRDQCNWVVLDVDINGYYQCENRPVSALEIHEAWHADRGQHIEQILDRPHFVCPTKCPGFDKNDLKKMFRDFTQHQTKDYYHNIYTSTVHGYNTRERRQHKPLNLNYAAIVSFPLAMDFTANDGEQGRQCTMTARRDLFNWPIQQTFMHAVMLGKRPSRRVELILDHTMPFFDHYEIAIGREGFRKLRSNRCKQSLPDGRTTFRARCIDTFGLPGHVATLTFNVHS
jgi:hypothetical protein